MYMEYRVVCRASRPDLLRAFLVGERGEVRLGVLAPEGGALTIRRRLSRQETVRLGKLLRCEVRQNEESSWERVQQPELLLKPSMISEQLRGVSGVMTKTFSERRYIAVPYDPKRPFPLTALFCFAKISVLDGWKYAVFAFDRHGKPVMP